MISSCLDISHRKSRTQAGISSLIELIALDSFGDSIAKGIGSIGRGVMQSTAFHFAMYTITDKFS